MKNHYQGDRKIDIILHIHQDGIEINQLSLQKGDLSYTLGITGKGSKALCLQELVAS